MQRQYDPVNEQSHHITNSVECVTFNGFCGQAMAQSLSDNNFVWCEHSELCTWSFHNLPESSSSRVVVSTAAFHARVRGSVPGLGGLKETKMFLPHPRVKVSMAGSLRVREVACSASDRQGSSFESCVWRTVSSQSSHHPQEVLLAQFSLYVHKGGLKPDSFHFILSSSKFHLYNLLEGIVVDFRLMCAHMMRFALLRSKQREIRFIKL